MSIRSSVSSKMSASALKVAELEMKVKLMELEVQKSHEQKEVLQNAYKDLVETCSLNDPGESRKDPINDSPNDYARMTENDKMSAVRDYVEKLPSEATKMDEPLVIRMHPKADTRPGDDTRTSTIRPGFDPIETAQLFNTCLSLPTRNMVKFRGDPKRYYLFIRSFDSTVARYTTDPATLLSYLIENCEGEARAAIEGCAILEPDEGYTEARNILQRRFGEPHVIARDCINGLTGGPVLKAEDNQGLAHLADSMRICAATLQQLHYESDLNACSTISAIVQRLPRHTQLRWHEVAWNRLKSGREPSFEDLAKFVTDRSDVLTTAKIYDTLSSGSRSPTITQTAKRSFDARPQWRGSVLTTQTSGAFRRPPVCPKCRGVHYLDQCPEFLHLEVEARGEFVKEFQLCFLCLKPNHLANTCRLRHSCGKEGCGAKHHPTLHRREFPSISDDNADEAMVNTTSVQPMSVSLGVIPIRINGSKGEVLSWALLDQGSDTTLIKTSLLTKLGLEPTPTPLRLRTLTGVSRLNSGVVQLGIKGRDLDENVLIKRAWCVERLPTVNPAKLVPQDFDRWPHLEGVELRSSDPIEVDLLIGSDVPMAHWVLEQRVGESYDPFAVRGPLGWILVGPVRPMSSEEGFLNYLSSDDGLNPIEECIRRLYNHDFNELSEVHHEPSVDDKEALKIMENSIRIVRGHFQIALPWKEGCPNLPDNRRLAYRRLQCLKNRLMKDDELNRLYLAKMTEYVEMGYAERVPDDEQLMTGPGTWYLPHHGVFKSQVERKLRVVLDCAAKTEGISLNSQLRTGPDLVNNLCGVLLRFRQFQYAMVADIESMFHQVYVPPGDRDALRYLWWPEGNLDAQPVAFRMKVHPFGATSSPSCASLALRHALMSLETSSGITSSIRVARSFYVDDCLLSLGSVEDLSRCATELRTTLSNFGFRLTKFSGNSPESLSMIPTLDLKCRTPTVDGQPMQTQKTLGIIWDPHSDHLLFKLAPWTQVPTRRSVLSYIASIYDPLGLIAPLILPVKRLIQCLCRRKAGWDENLGPSEREEWQRWLEGMGTLETLRISRWFGLSEGQRDGLELHCFSDASETGYGAAIYVVLTQDRERPYSTLAAGKSRVTPLKAVTIPRLELTAAVLVAKMLSFVRQEIMHPQPKTYLWTDSMAVLSMLRNTRTRYETFVANRLSTIHALTKLEDWRYVNSKLNPADLASRGLTKDDDRLQLWLNGPDFILQPETTWPTQPSSFQYQGACELEPSASVNITSIEPVSENIIDRFEGTHSWTDLLRRIGWVIRFAVWSSARFRSSMNILTPPVGRLNATDLKLAERWVCAATQAQCFQPDLLRLKGRRQTSPSARPSEKLDKLLPFLDGNLLRVGGRLRFAPLTFEEKHPIILPAKHFVSKLLINHMHEVNGHMGTLQVLSALRERFWIVRGQATVRKILRECFHCRRWQSGREQQLMAPLPDVRLRVEAPFSTVGVDYFGPLMVKRGRGREKRYGCLFTCLSMRAVHLEVSHSLETDSFLCAMSRFMARRGCPSRVYSDNGTNFQGAAAEVRCSLKSWDQGKIQASLASKGCDWHFIPPKASHQGGVWERVIRSIRRIMRSIFGDQLVTDEVLHTVLIEIEGILNNRPLTKLSDDPNDPAALTPNHILLQRPSSLALDISTVTSPLTRRWKFAQRLADLFWSRWLKEYLPTLQQRQKWLGETRDLKVGDLVLVANLSTPRGIWPKGVVEKATSGSDGRVREVTVRTINGIFRRDIRKICLLETVEKLENARPS